MGRGVKQGRPKSGAIGKALTQRFGTGFDQVQFWRVPRALGGSSCEDGRSLREVDNSKSQEIDGFLGCDSSSGLFHVGLVVSPGRSLPTAGLIAPISSGEATASSEQGKSLAIQLSEAFEEAAGRVSVSVVPIFAERVVETRSPFGMPDSPLQDFFGDDFLHRFFGAPPEGQRQTVRSMGSGRHCNGRWLHFDEHHVVEGADNLTVVLDDGRKLKAKIVGTDPPTDVGVIKVEGSNLSEATLGNSDDVRVGQWIIAVGNPFQLLHTVTAGIISAKGRSAMGLADYEDFIQTDASINPGNSGGALADLDGCVIGINTAIGSPTGGNVGIGFAIPINMAKAVMDSLVSEGQVSRGYLSLIPQDIDENLAAAMGLKSTEGALVADVTAGGPADKGGIQRGDVIVEVDGQKVTNATQLRNLVARASPGKEVRMKVLRNGREQELRVTLGERPKELAAQSPEARQPESRLSERLGLTIQDLTPDIARQLGYEGRSGAVVAGVAAGSPAEEAGLQRGDLIEEVSRNKIQSPAEFERLISSAKSGQQIPLVVRRGPGVFFAAVKMP